jgi:type VI secretion system protein ImpM
VPSEVMSAVPVLGEGTGEAGPPAWYGKIPGAGDFVNRRLPYELADWWERWVQQGMSTMRQHGAEDVERYYTVAPVWSFLIPAGAGAACVQAGCIAPSCDRVGRYYPLIVTQPIRARAYWSGLPDAADAFYRQIGNALLDAIRNAQSPEHLEQALIHARLPAAGEAASANGSNRAQQPSWPNRQDPVEPSAWPRLSEYFDPYGATSFWWTNRIDGSPLRTQAHTGMPDARLFVRLFGASQGG